MKAVNLVAVTATLNLLLQLYMTALGNSVVAVLFCDFSEDVSKFKMGTVLLCKRTFNEDDVIEVSCPRDVDGVNYSIYPENPTKYAFVYNLHSYGNRNAAFGFKKLPLEQIFGKAPREPIVQWKDEATRDTLIIKYPRDGTLVRRLDSHLAYICKGGKHDFNAADVIQSLQYALRERRNISENVVETIPSHEVHLSHTEPLAVFKLDMAFIPIVTHGCGHRSGNLFLNQKKRNTDEAYETCTVDIMQTPNLGFYCDGIIHPHDCFDRLIGYHDRDIPNLAFGRLPPSIHGLHYMNYDRTRYPKPFSGSCYCKDNDTNEVRASITVTRGVTQTCDLASLLFKNRILPFVEDWCDVVLHPVDTLTIIYPPITGIYDHVHNKYMNFEGVDHPCVAAFVPSRPETYLLKGPILFSAGRLKHRTVESMLLGNSLSIQHDKENRIIMVRITKSQLEKSPLIFHYLWSYKCPRWMHADINASVKVKCVFDVGLRTNRVVHF